nr:enoyl-CoA hydratase/isomerase family protein [Phytohabitans suffuscus]
MEEIILVERRDQVAIVTLNRPHRLNALTQDLVRAVSATLTSIAEDEDSSARAIVLTGAGRGFCAGLDLFARQALDADAPDHPPRASPASSASRAWSGSSAACRSRSSQLSTGQPLALAWRWRSPATSGSSTRGGPPSGRAEDRALRR